MKINSNSDLLISPIITEKTTLLQESGKFTFEVAKEAIGRARAGEGPTLIEAQTYRYLGHAGHDDPLTYRSEEEQKYYMDRDCITNFKSYILDSSIADEEELNQIEVSCETAVAQSVEFADNSPFPEPDALHEDVYTSYRN